MQRSHFNVTDKVVLREDFVNINESRDGSPEATGKASRIHSNLLSIHFFLIVAS
jgi:hypothetical protein